MFLRPFMWLRIRGSINNEQAVDAVYQVPRWATGAQKVSRQYTEVRCSSRIG
jgi:hypothetical protein